MRSPLSWHLFLLFYPPKIHQPNYTNTGCTVFGWNWCRNCILLAVHLSPSSCVCTMVYTAAHILTNLTKGFVIQSEDKVWTSIVAFRSLRLEAWNPSVQLCSRATNSTSMLFWYVSNCRENCFWKLIYIFWSTDSQCTETELTIPFRLLADNLWPFLLPLTNNGSFVPA